ncbi:MAG: hypothetical protein KGJ41_07270 [Rhodospirillales bacterium]|nr:hypothetical protein [Rhodospirillales bacterium]
MSRSGSSALTRVISLHGATLPETLLEASNGNPRGHFEPQRLMELNNEILQAHGATYWDPLAIPPGWFDGAEAGAFAERIARIIVEEFGDARLFVLKDPRLSRLAPLYLAALRQLDIAPVAVIPLRHPAEAVASLVKRDGTDPHTAELLWLRDMLGCEYFTRGLARVWSPYEDLLTDWQRAIAQIGAGLALDWPRPSVAAAGEVDAFLSPALRGFDARRAPPPVEPGPLAQRLWQAAQAGEGPGLRAEFDAIGAIVAELDRLSVPHRAAARQHRRELESELRQLADPDQREADRRAELDAMRATVANLNEALAITRASTSWRVTAPLRAAGRLVRQLAGAGPTDRPAG